MIRRILFLFTILLLLFPASAQENPSETFTYQEKLDSMDRLHTRRTKILFDSSLTNEEKGKLAGLLFYQLHKLASGPPYSPEEIARRAEARRQSELRKKKEEKAQRWRREYVIADSIRKTLADSLMQFSVDSKVGDKHRIAAMNLLMQSDDPEVISFYLEHLKDFWIFYDEKGISAADNEILSWRVPIALNYRGRRPDWMVMGALWKEFDKDIPTVPLWIMRNTVSSQVLADFSREEQKKFIDLLIEFSEGKRKDNFLEMREMMDW